MAGVADGVIGGVRWWLIRLVGGLVGWRLGMQRWVVTGVCGWLSARPFVWVRR